MSLPERLWASGGEKCVYSSVQMIVIVVRDTGRRHRIAPTLQQISGEMPLPAQMLLEWSLLTGVTARMTKKRCGRDGGLLGSPVIFGPIRISAN